MLIIGFVCGLVASWLFTTAIVLRVMRDAKLREAQERFDAADRELAAAVVVVHTFWSCMPDEIRDEVAEQHPEWAERMRTFRIQ